MSRNKKTSKSSHWDPLGMLLLLAVFSFSAYQLVNTTISTIRLHRHGITGTAKIDCISEVAGYRGRRKYYPVVIFEGKRMAAPRNCFSFSYSRGDIVTIRYRKEQPHIFLIDDFFYTWGYLFCSPWAFFFFLGLLYGANRLRKAVYGANKYEKAIGRYHDS